jgi:hypothetical protein
MKCIYFLLLLSLTPSEVDASMFGEENVPLYKLVMGQILELEKLAEALNIAKEDRAFLLEINDGINRVTSQLESIEEIVKRAEKLDPKSIRRISDITNLINDAKSLDRDINALLQAELLLTESAVRASSLQSETAYSVGKELIVTGSSLSREARTASPGRAAQISAAAGTSQMLAMGTLLQTISHLTEIETISLELKKSELQQNLRIEQDRKKSTLEFLKRGRK